MMGNDNGLVYFLNGVTVFLCKHVDLSLIETKLADISLEEENICALHARVHDL